MAPTSILKSTNHNAVGASAGVKSRDERNREVALYHANLIQSQKDIEAAIVEAIETLLDFPANATSTSGNPTEDDVIEFKKLIHPFTPNDYDELIEERRLDRRCGYVFCTNKPKTTTGGSKLKILGTKRGHELKIMDREKAECWCSRECAKRALFIKVQLIEEPAWSRRGGSGPELEILTQKAEKATQPGQSEAAAAQDEIERAMRDLAFERGDEAKPERSVGMVTDTVIERDNVRPAIAPHLDDERLDAVEGYAPKITASKEVRRELGDLEWDF